jgi:hypothetical protein
MYSASSFSSLSSAADIKNRTLRKMFYFSINVFRLDKISNKLNKSNDFKERDPVINKIVIIIIIIIIIIINKYFQLPRLLCFITEWKKISLSKYKNFPTSRELLREF